jgi:uncharacterized FAD-dependent dehydrogenase
MIRINQLKLHVVEPTEKLRNKSAAILKINASHIRKLEILRRSIDARKKPEIYFSYTVLLETDLKDEAGLVRRLRNRDVSYRGADGVSDAGASQLYLRCSGFRIF